MPTPTPTPVSNPGRGFTPPPVLMTRTPRPSIAPSRRPTPVAQPVRGIVMTKMAIAGLCLITFSCGIICSVALYRFAPRFRPDCGGPAVAVAGDALDRPATTVYETAPVQAAPAAGFAPEAIPTAPAVPPASARVEAPALRERPAPARPIPAPHHAATSTTGRGSVGRRVPTPGAGNGSIPPTGIWIDPFAE